MIVCVCVCVLYHAWGRRAGTWSVMGFQASGPPVGLVAHVCQPASEDKPVGSGSSAALRHASQTFPLSGPNREREGHRGRIFNCDVKSRNNAVIEREINRNDGNKVIRYT